MQYGISGYKSIEGQCLPTDCWSHIQAPVDRDERSSILLEGDICHHVELASRHDFLDRNYDRISKYPNSSHVGLASIPHTGQKFSSSGNRNSAISRRTNQSRGQLYKWATLLEFHGKKWSQYSVVKLLICHTPEEMVRLYVFTIYLSNFPSLNEICCPLGIDPTSFTKNKE